jgi:DNA-binding GntR family transcriptional regulator
MRRVAHRSVVDLVVDEIRRSLLDRVLVPGEPFSIVELSNRLGVSHIPVREALRLMAAEGLVELRPGRSARVPPLTRTDMTQIFHLRALLEADAMARSVPLYDDAHLSAIEEVWESLLVVPPVTAGELFDRHRAFHELLIVRSAAPWDRRLLDMLWRAADRYVALIILEKDLLAAPANLRQLHQPLLEAAKSRSTDQVTAAVHEHCDMTVGLIATLLEAG